MKTLSQVKDVIANRFGYPSWFQIDFTECYEEPLRDEVAKLYAQEALNELVKEYRYADGSKTIESVKASIELK